jgi:TetR/AcrR family transcriptional regulator, transcriptional repressor for nem operon
MKLQKLHFIETLDEIPTSWYVIFMKDISSHAPTKPNAKSKLLDAAVTVIRTKGYSATTVDELCATAGVTKGAFFHHFKSKDEFAVSAADYWSEITGARFAVAPYHDHADPLDRVIGYLEFRKELLQGSVPEFTCLVGTMVQETFQTAPAIRDACDRSISGHAAKLESDLEQAIKDRGMFPDWTAPSLALHTQAVLQGAFILAKGKGGSEIAAQSIDHLIRYVKFLFNESEKSTANTNKERSLK